MLNQKLWQMITIGCDNMAVNRHKKPGPAINEAGKIQNPMKKVTSCEGEKQMYDINHTFTSKISFIFSFLCIKKYRKLYISYFLFYFTPIIYNK